MNTNTRIGMEAVVSYFPEERMSAADYAYLKPVIPPWMTPPLEKRRLPRPDANEVMALNVVRKALDEASLQPSDIDLIVCQTFGGRFIVPGLAGYIHEKLGFRLEVPAWNIQDICASFLDGCYVAWNSIRAGDGFRRALVVAVSALETGGWGTDTSDGVFAVMGDGAGAAVVSGQNLKCEFLAYGNQTYGEVYEPAVMTFDPPAHPELVGNRDFRTNVACGPHLGAPFEGLMDRVFKTMASRALSEVSAKAGMRPNDIGVVIAHQAFPGLLEVWMADAETVGVPRNRWKTTFQKYGNVGAVDVPATLADRAEFGGIPRNTVAALFSPGGGGHTPTLLVRWLE